MDTLRRNAPACHPRMRPLEDIHESYLSIDRLRPRHHNPTSIRNAERILAKASRPLIKTHGLPGLPELRPDARAFADRLLERADALYTVREGRQVMCSHFVAWGETEPDTRARFAEHLKRPDERGRPLPRQWADHVSAWLDHPGTRLVRYEDLVRDPLGELRALGAGLGLALELRDPVLPRPLTRTWHHRAARLLGRLESTNLFARVKIKPHEVFDDELDAFFEHHAGDVQRRLGYAAGACGHAGGE